MKKLFLFTFLLVVVSSVFGQINKADSTVQVLGYWSKNEKQGYHITNEEYQTQGTDTISKIVFNYDVDIAILDSTYDSYTIEWNYKNYKVESSNPHLNKLLAACSKDMKIVIKTNELGVFQEVENWKDIKELMKKTMKTVKKEFKDIQGIKNVVKQLEETYSSKEAIEQTAINEIYQFYVFNGVKYKLKNTVEWKEKVANIYGSEPFETDCVAYLDEIDVKKNIYSMKLIQEVNQQQLIDATYNYSMNLAKARKIPFNLKREDFNGLTNEITTVSVIHESGWPIYSLQTKSVVSERVTSVEKNTIQIKEIE
jgi:hypothetical protein